MLNPQGMLIYEDMTVFPDAVFLFSVGNRQASRIVSL